MARRLLVLFVALLPLISCARATEKKMVPKEDIAAYLKRADDAADIENYDIAMENLDAAISSPDASQKELAAAYFNRGNIQLKQGNDQSAVEDYTKAIQLDPGMAAAFKNRGDINFIRRRHKDAIQDYDKALSLNPDDPDILNYRGNALYKMGQYKAAIRDYTAALRLKPKSPAIAENLAWVFATCREDNIRDGDRALTLAMQSIEYAKGDDAQRLATLAAAYAEIGMYSEAAETQEKAFTLIKRTGTWNDVYKYKKMLETYQSKKPWREGT